jgi:hypothetical protein
MVDVRCPMCGKPNPADLEVCQFCQARLKPIRIDSPADAEPSAFSQPSDPKGASSEEAALPDWLQSLRQRQESLPDAAEPQEDVPDWLSNLRPPSDEQPPATEETIPDWLSGIQVESPPPAEAEQVELEHIQIDEQEPDWLSKISFNQPSEEPEISAQQPGEPEGESLPVEPESEESLAPKEGETPAWIKEYTEETVAPPSQNNLTDWQPDQPPAVPGVSPEAQEELPDWMAGILARQAAEKEQPHARAEIPVAALGAAALAQAANEPRESAQEPQPKGAEPFSSKEGLLAELGALDTGELPDWLAGIGPSQVEKPETAPPAASSEPGLAPSEDLPSWLEAMRPVESAAILAAMPDLSHETVESAGPLSGLRGVLPAEPGVAQGQKPSVHSIKLQVSETNQANAALIEQMVKTEGEARPILRRSVITTQRIFRISIAILLFLAILWPLVTGSPQASLPAFTPETFTLNQLIEGLQPGAPVLLAFDYQPGLSSEMDAAAGGVVDHLMVKGAYLTVISTASTGPAQAERLLAMVNQSGQHKFTSPDQYIDLGFIPGGSTGLQGFAQSPPQMMPLALDGNNPWQGSPLQAVTDVKDFALTIVITDNPDDARAWVEQVGPALEDQPLAMVISAQAEPMVRPYVESNPQQIKGLVVGLAGGASFEDLNGRTGLGSIYWNAFSLGMLVAVLLILIGGLVTVVSTVWARTEATEGEKQA